MDKIKINGSTSYEYIIDRGLLTSSGNILRDSVGGNNALIVTDTNISNLYLEKVSASLENADYKTHSVIFDASESSKNLNNYTILLNTLSENNFSKSDIIIALGGGLIGDLAGFAAATYKRGLKFVIMPTTLLAAVDSSIGGKTAINLPNAKNSVGIIRNPSIILCDPTCLSTLPIEALRDGYAEIVKYGILEGIEIIDALNTAISSADYSDIILKSVNIKKKYVEEDESDLNLRQFLNLGHLFGHAIEACSNYTISHGSAVAKGLNLEIKCATTAGFCDESMYRKINDILVSLNFDLSCDYSSKELLKYMLQDKRIQKETINVIIPISFGDYKIMPFSTSNFLKYIEVSL